MQNVSRRRFLGTSLGAAAALPLAAPAMSAPACVTGSLPAFLPNRLTVDCASQQNFRLFRQNDAYLGLAGVVSMTRVSGRYGSYLAGSLILFPWLKPKGLALGQARLW